VKLVLTWLACIVALAGCTREDMSFSARAQRYQHLSEQQSPATWVTGSRWTFIASDKKGAIAGSIVFRVTDEPVKVCIAGNWKKLEIVGNSSLPAHAPAYLLGGRTLEVLLSSDLCDSYDEFSGDLSDKGFTGTHENSGMFGGQTYGRVYGISIGPD